MFKQLLQMYPLLGNIEQKQLCVRQVIQSNKKPTGSQILKDLEQEYSNVLAILKNHPQIVIEFVFSHFAIEDCLRLMEIKDDAQFEKQGNGFLRLLNDVGKFLQPNRDETAIQWFSKMYTRYSSLEKVLIFLRQLSANLQQKYSDEYFPEFLADFIKGSALAVEAYLKLKTQSPKFDVDYIEHGQKFVKFTEKWIKELYINVIKHMRVPDSKSHLKLSLLNGICDIVGALMQVQRQGHIDSQICDQILEQCYHYVKKVTNLAEFNQIYLKNLKQMGFNIPPTKIILPNFYRSNVVTYPQQAYCYLLFRFLSESESIYSDQQIVNFLLPLLNQLAHFEYQIKLKVQNLFADKIRSKSIQIKTCHQGGIPLAIVWFNLWHYQSKGNIKILGLVDQLNADLKGVNPKTYVSNLMCLTNFHVENLQNQINQFIGQKALQISRQNPQLTKLLIKNMEWKNMNERGQQIWFDIMAKLSLKPQIKCWLDQLVKTKIKPKSQKNNFEAKMQKMLQN